MRRFRSMRARCIGSPELNGPKNNPAPRLTESAREPGSVIRGNQHAGLDLRPCIDVGRPGMQGSFPNVGQRDDPRAAQVE